MLTPILIAEIEITSLPDGTIGQLYTLVNNHNQTIGYGIPLDKEWFYANTNNPRKIKCVICHELAHIRVPMKHDKEFVRTARMLGAGSDAGEYVDNMGVV
jgi:hypothetical protein